MNFNYPQICRNLLKNLPERQREVISRRFGLETGQRETLEAIGRSYGLTRERVRQIQEDGFSKLKSLQSFRDLQKVFRYFTNQLKNIGGLRKEDILLSQLGEKSCQPQVLFLLTLGENFERFSETENSYSLWTINNDSLTLAQKIIDSFYNKLREINRPVSLNEFESLWEKEKEWLPFYLEISKKIQKNEEGLFGLKDWPEINPRRVKDRAYLAFKKTKAPLHFTKVAELIGNSCLPQTVHNELIKDPRFVLVGRGMYALEEWGYYPGQVKDVISKILKEAKEPLTKEEVLKKVLEQRVVKENTILLNLSNKKYFLKTPQGKYLIKEA